MKKIVRWKVLSYYMLPVLITIGVVVASLVLSNTSAIRAASPFGKSGHRYLIPGQLSSLLKRRSPIHATQTDARLDLSIGLNVRNPDELDRLIVSQNDPNSSLYHSYITPQEFTQRFGPTQSTIDAVEAYLRSQKLDVGTVSSNHLLIQASGSVQNVEQAFNVRISDYAMDGRTIYAPTDEPSVPASLAGMILNVSGLDNIARYHRSSQPLAGAKPRPGPSGGLTPGEIRTAYDINPLISGGTNGSGQTVGIFELDGYKASDVNAYLNYYGLGSPRYSNVLVDGATNTPGQAAVEVELDMELVSAVAPGAAQKIYIGQNNTTGVNDLYNRIVTDNSAKVVSISWGLCEAATGDAEIATLHNIFKQGAAQGQAFFAASGDFGAYDCGDNNLAVDSPADDPYVVGVGGTTLHTASDGTYRNESAWSCATCTQRSQNGTGSGGGISAYFARPSYQSGPNLTNQNREVPDVSANADPKTGYSVYCTVTDAGCPRSGWIVVGGTSAAAPLWAGIAADTNQYLAAQGKPTLGSASAQLYRLYNTSQSYAPYHDITTGSNLYYDATQGYDTASGIGTPDVWNIARDLVKPSAGGGGSGGSGGSTMQMLTNPGFEDGQSPWQQSSVGGYQGVATSNPHSGSYSAYLCGYDSCKDEIWQTVTLPGKTTKAVLSYWLYIDSQDSRNTCYDNFYARIRSTRGITLKMVQTRCNANATGWTQYSFDLTSDLHNSNGQQIQVYFGGTTDNNVVSGFFVDDVALNVTHS